MRLAILADVHGNLPALEAVLADVRQYDVDGYVVAGDLTGGPQQVEAINLLRSLNSQFIRGNGENYILRFDSGDAPEGWRVSRQWAPMRWAYRQLDRETLDLIAAWPEQLVLARPDTDAIRIVHGSPRSASEKVLPGSGSMALTTALAQTAEPVLVCAHTHIPWQHTRNGRLALNPGAVCGPLNGEVGAQYALLTWQDHHWQAEHHAVPYDLQDICAAYQASGLLEHGGFFARVNLLCIETGQNLAEDFLAHAYRLAALAGFKNCTVVPDDIWEQAAATWDWRLVNPGI
jgi:predicted phosphodiesterase